MKCSKYREWISSQMDGQLDPHHVSTLEDHLQACAACRAYREELRLGARFLHATTPVLPDDFDWKLQLRLSRAMREAAAESHPWRDERAGWRAWLGRAVPSAAVGLAAVLAVAIMLPEGSSDDAARTAALAGDPGLRLPTQTASVPAYLDGARRPLAGRDVRGFSGSLQRPVSSERGFAAFSLPTADEAALLRIRDLEQDNQTLKRRLFAKDRQIQYLQAQLDSLTEDAVDNQ
jgi:hypothetical protein